METIKAHPRRLREGWYARHLRLDRPGLDIGCQRDPIAATFRRWDLIYGDPDATRLEGVPDGAFWTVYASHVLEHLEDPAAALREWARVLAPGGKLIVVVPHRDLYERRTELPSEWNHEHKTYWLPEGDHELPTLGLAEVIRTAIPGGEMVDLRVCDEGFADPGPGLHAAGEYSIEAIVRMPGNESSPGSDRGPTAASQPGPKRRGPRGGSR